MSIQLTVRLICNFNSTQMLHELTAHVKRAAEDDSVKALLLSAVRVERDNI